LELARYYFYAGVLTNDYRRAREEVAIVRRKLPNNADALVIEARISRHEGRWDASLVNLKKANELDPRNADVFFYLEETYGEMRLYSEQEQLLRKKIEADTGDLGLRSLLAKIKLARGDLVAAQALLDQLPIDFSPGYWIWDTRFRSALFKRDYDAAARVIAITPAKWTELAFDGLGRSWAEGQLARARGDKGKALAAFEAARKKLETSDLAKDGTSLSELAMFDAGLGRKQDAIREVKRAVQLEPITKDAVNGPIIVTRSAVVYEWTGERDRALEQLEIVATIPNGPTHGDLRFNPCWNDLRADPRFDKIIVASKAASK
jgi:tetratricopeptide (TPR) repeat protein